MFLTKQNKSFLKETLLLLALSTRMLAWLGIGHTHQQGKKRVAAVCTWRKSMLLTLVCCMVLVMAFAVLMLPGIMMQNPPVPLKALSDSGTLRVRDAWNSIQDVWRQASAVAQQQPGSAGWQQPPHTTHIDPTKASLDR